MHPIVLNYYAVLVARARRGHGTADHYKHKDSIFSEEESMADKKIIPGRGGVPGITPVLTGKPGVPGRPPAPTGKPPAPGRPPAPGKPPGDPKPYSYYGDYGSDEVISVILKKYAAVELLNALIIALGIVPPPGKGKGKGGGAGYPYGGKPPGGKPLGGSKKGFFNRR